MFFYHRILSDIQRRTNPNVLQIISQNRKRKTLSNSFDEATVTLIRKPYKDSPKKITDQSLV